jgi:sugar lactone lactonase YvrE
MNMGQHFLAVQNEMGETPIWVPEENALYWVDAAQKIIYRFDAATGEQQSFRPDVPVRGLCRRASGGWLLIADTGLAFWNAHTNQSQFILNPCADQPGIQVNDGAIDRQGRLLVGSYNPQNLSAADGSLYRLDPDLSLHVLDTGLILSNGIGVSPDGKTIYVAEMFANHITAYDYDTTSGTVSHRRVFVRIPPERGYPDGVTVDRDGFVWMAHWGGWRVTRYDPDGQLERTIQLPVEIVTCIGFGGAQLEELYITTAWYSLNTPQRNEQPLAGDLFRSNASVQGIAEPGFLG